MPIDKMNKNVVMVLVMVFGFLLCVKIKKFIDYCDKVLIGQMK